MMFNVWFRIALGLAISLVPPVSMALAQEEEAVLTRVIQLENLDLNDAIRLVQELHGDALHAVAGADATDRLIVRGFASEVEAVATLISEVDRQQPASAGISTEFIPIQTYPAGVIMPLVQSLPGSGARRIGVDQVNRQLVVTGSPEEIQAVRLLVAAIDRPARSLRLDFSFIRGEMEADSDADEAELPKAMMPIAKTLAENGFGQLTLMAPLIVRADSGERFESSAFLLAGHGDSKDENLQFKVEGRAQIQPGEEAVQLRLEAYMEGLRASQKGERPGPRPGFGIETTITAKLGAYTILAASPSSTQHGSVVALVVRVTQD